VVGDVSEGELLENQKHLVAPAGVIVGLHVENGGDEGVLDTDGLGVEVDDGSGLVSQQGIPERLTRTTIANIAGKGGGVVLVLDGGLGNFSLAGSASERARRRHRPPGPQLRPPARRFGHAGGRRPGQRLASGSVPRRHGRAQCRPRGHARLRRRGGTLLLERLRHRW